MQLFKPHLVTYYQSEAFKVELKVEMHKTRSSEQICFVMPAELSPCICIRRPAAVKKRGNGVCHGGFPENNLSPVL